MDARAESGLGGLGRGLNVLALGAGQRRDARRALLAADLGGDGAHALKVAVAGDGEPRLQDVHAEHGELLGHTPLLFVVHGAARRLLAVAQSGVEEDDLVVRSHQKAPFRMDNRITLSYADIQMYCNF